MTDPDPPDKISYSPSPPDSPVESPGTYPVPDCPEDHKSSKQQGGCGYKYPDIPEISRLVHHRIEDIRRDALVGFFTFY